MAHRKPEWEKIYKDYVKSGLARGEYIRKYQLSTYAFEKFKKLEEMNNTKDIKVKTDPLFVPVQLETKKIESVMRAKESVLELFCENIKIIVTEQTNQILLLWVGGRRKSFCITKIEIRSSH